jgi:hypothetical protein
MPTKISEAKKNPLISRFAIRWDDLNRSRICWTHKYESNSAKFTLNQVRRKRPAAKIVPIFQPTGNAKAAITDDFLVLSDQVTPDQSPGPGTLPGHASCKAAKGPA